MLWLGVAYLGALAALFAHRLLATDSFTGDVERIFTLENFRDLVTIDVYRTITLRTLGIAALVTVVDAVLALPIAFFMAKVASARTQRAAGGRGAHAAVGALPRQGLRVARRCSPRAGSWTGCSTPSGSARRATA